MSKNKSLFLSTMALAVAVSTTGVCTPAPVEAAKVTSFKDVPKTHYAYDAVTYMAANEIIKGYADNTYRLNKPVTRAQAAKMIAVSIGAKPTHAYKMDFKDVTTDNGAYDHIRALTQRGLFKNAEKFNPNKSLTRGQMAKLLVLGYHIVTDDNDFIIFDDVHQNNGAYKYIIAIAELNITTTRPGGKFNPNEPVTRGQMAAFLYRTMQFDENRKKGLITYDNQKKGYVDQNKNLIKPTPDKPKPTPPKPAPEPEQPSLAAQAIIAINVKRKNANISTLLADPALNRMASARAEDLAKIGKLTHVTPTYGTVEEMFKEFTYSYVEYGESLGSGFDNALEITNAWYESADHKVNLMSPVFTHMGAGTGIDKNGENYWVILYSKKK